MLARQIEETIDVNYGVLMPAYLSKLVTARERIARVVPNVVNRFVKHVGADVDPWEIRFASAFGIALAGALVLVHFGLAPWTWERAWTATTGIYRRARSASVSIKDTADKLVRELMKGTFIRLRKGESVPPEQAKQLLGVIRTTPKGESVIAIELDRLRRLLTPPVVLRSVLQTLCQDGIVLPGHNGRATRELMIKGLTGPGRRRYVLFVEKALRERMAIVAARSPA